MNWQQILANIVLLVGVFKIISLVYQLLRPYVRIPRNHYKTYGGGWVVVTGATDGIGLAYCYQFARLNFNICMISRSFDKLQKVKGQINSKFPNVLIKTIPANFLDSHSMEFFDNIYTQIKDLDISILVNNVGSYYPGFFQNQTKEHTHAMITVNLLPISILTRILIPKFLQRKSKSAVINLSSLAASGIFISMCTYSASKFFDDYLSRSLEYQYSGKIDFLSVRPGFVTTNMTKNMTSYMGIPHATTQGCVRGSLRDLGRFSITAGYWIHQVQETLLNALPQRIHSLILSYLASNIVKIYQDMQKKESLNQKKVN